MEQTKLIENGAVYSRTEYSDGTIVVEKVDPYIAHNAPSAVAAGTTLIITFQIFDYDGEMRTDSDGTLMLRVEGADVPLPIDHGLASLTLELHANARIAQQPPYFRDARLVEPIDIRVVAE